MLNSMRLSAVFMTMALGGCATHPLPEDVTRKTTYDIVERIRCEAKEAVVDHVRPGSELDSAAIGYEFLFTITENNNNSGDATFKYPFTNGTFTLGVNAGAEKQRLSNRNFRIVETFRDLRRVDCSGQTAGRNRLYPIAGSVGLYETIDTYIQLERLTDLSPKGDMPAFADRLMYTTKLFGGVNPSVVLTPVTHRFRLAEANLHLLADRTDIHQVTVAMAVEHKKRPFVSRSGTRMMMAPITPLAAAAPQSDADARGKVLLELDRQRVLDENVRVLRLLGLTP